MKDRPAKRKMDPEEARRRHSEAKRRWRLRNPDKQEAARQKWIAENPERNRQRMRDWNKANPDKRRQQVKTWMAKNKDKARALWEVGSHRRRALKLSDGGKLSKGLANRLLIAQKSLCPCCRSNLKETGYHLDHIEPLARGGKNIDSNIQLLCPRCNCMKGKKKPEVFMQERGFLL